MQKLVVNCETGQEAYVDLTPDEQAAYDAQQNVATETEAATTRQEPHTALSEAQEAIRQLEARLAKLEGGKSRQGTRRRS